MNLLNAWQRVSSVDNNLCLLVNRISHRRMPAQFFRFISRIGDGVFWYALMLVLPLSYGFYGLYTSAVMAIVGIVNLFLYKQCKGSISRERPYVTIDSINLVCAPLDRYSFPSGHTLQAVGFTVVATSFFPALWVLLYPMTFLIALSRPILGLHYPSDVVVAALTGYIIAHGVLLILQP
ncbi:MAG: phosphatase PAP2 family protein [Pseudomonadota bacterium]